MQTAGSLNVGGHDIDVGCGLANLPEGEGTAAAAMATAEGSAKSEMRITILYALKDTLVSSIGTLERVLAGMSLAE